MNFQLFKSVYTVGFAAVVTVLSSSNVFAANKVKFVPGVDNPNFSAHVTISEEFWPSEYPEAEEIKSTVLFDSKADFYELGLKMPKVDMPAPENKATGAHTQVVVKFHDTLYSFANCLLSLRQGEDGDAAKITAFGGCRVETEKKVSKNGDILWVAAIFPVFNQPEIKQFDLK